MFEENIALVAPKRVETKIPWSHCFCGEGLIDHVAVSLKTIDYVFPLYVYPKKKNKKAHSGGLMMLFEPEQQYINRRPNISPEVFEKLQSVYDKKLSPENIFYYIYAVFYGAIFRETYEEFLKIDFPRVPFAKNYGLFIRMGKLGKRLADLHLLKSPELNKPSAKYQGTGENDRIEKIVYAENERRIYINKDKYFEGAPEDVWNFYIGGYRVLQKYLKDRKGRLMNEAPRYCKIVTALNKTIKIQKEIDAVYPEIEKELIEF